MKKDVQKFLMQSKNSGMTIVGSFFLFLVFSALIWSCSIMLEKYILSDALRVVFLQVERGDSTYIRTPHKKEIVIDGGQNLSALVALDRHRPFWDRHIDLLIITHPDSDHYYGFIPLLERFSVDNILMTGVQKEDPLFQKIFLLAEEKGVKILYADQFHDFRVDGVEFDVLSPLSSLLGVKKSGNDTSLVLKMTYQGRSMLFTGDIEKKGEDMLLRSGSDIKAEVLKVPHHGSKTSSSVAFLKAVNPDLAVFTTGVENRFGHPHTEITERYRSMGIDFINSRDGDVVLEW